MAEAKRDREELGALFNGCSVSMLGQIFNLDNREVARRIVDLKKSGDRDGFPVYDLAAAARYLVDPIINIQAYILSLKPADLPVPLQKAYWEGLLSKQKWQENAKDLWRTEKVMDVFVDTFKKLRATLVMFDDSVEAAVGVNEAQRKMIRLLADRLLDDIRESLVEEFALSGLVNEL